MSAKTRLALPAPIRFSLPDWVHKKRMLTLLSLEELRWEFLRARQHKRAVRVQLVMMQEQYRKPH